jgi:hypothetical protein
MQRHSQANFEPLKCECDMVKLIKKMHAGKLDYEQFPCVGEKPKPSSQMMAMTRGKNSAVDKAHNPRLFTFVIGGMSHHEVVSVSNL